MPSTELSHPTVEKGPSQMRALGTLTRYFLLGQLRSTTTLVFGLLFPLVLLIIFGLIGDRFRRVRVGIADEVTASSRLVEVLRQDPAVTLHIASEPELQQQLGASKLDSVLKFEPEANTESTLEQGRVTLRYTAANPQAAAISRSVVELTVARLNLQAVYAEQPPPLVFAAVPIEGRYLRYIDFVLPGQLGLSLLFTAVFGTAAGLVFLRRTQVMKRLFVTPIRPVTILCGQALSRLVIATFHVGVVLAVGIYFFEFQLPHGWVTVLEMMLLSAVSLVAFLGFGFLIAGGARSMESVSPIANLFTVPQFLLSGTFFSTSGFPGWLQTISEHLPLTYFNIAMRKVANEGAGLQDIAMPLVGLVVWSLLSYLLAAKIFRWT